MNDAHWQCKRNGMKRLIERDWTRVRAFVTGGAGFIGSHLVDALQQRGAAVAVLDDLSSGRRENVAEHTTFFHAELRDKEAVFEAVRSFEPTHVFHQAAQASVQRSVNEPTVDAEINLIGGLHVLEAAREVGVERFVFASTGGALYGEVPEGEAAPETWPAAPKSPYGASKAAFEQYLDVYRETYGLASTILRYANVYGPRQDPFGEAGVVAIFVERLLQGKPVTVFGRRSPGDGGGIRDYVAVDDVVQANVLAVQQSLDGFYNVGTGVGTTTRDLLRAVEAALSVKAAVHDAPPRAGDLERSVLDATKLARSGWHASISLEEGIRRTVHSWKQKSGRV